MSDQHSQHPEDPSSQPFPPVSPEGAPSGAFPPPHAPPLRPPYPGTPMGAESNERSMPPPGQLPAVPPIEGYPTAAQAYAGQPAVGVPVAVPRPATVTLAVRLMWVGAVMAVLQSLTVLFSRDSMGGAIEDAFRNQDQSYTAAQIDSLVNVAMGFAIGFGLIMGGLWVFMAWANGRGMRWARIVASVLFGISLVFFVIGLFGFSWSLSAVLNIFAVLVGAAVVVALWQRDTSAYIGARSRRPGY